MGKININSNFKARIWQREVIENVFNPTYCKGYYHIIKSRRQCGKSLMIEMILLKKAIETAKCNSFYLSPTIPQSRKVYNELKECVIKTPVYKKHNDSNLEIALINGSTISFKSAEQGENLRGFTANGLVVVDEAAYVSDDVFHSILAWKNVSQCPVILCSTPRFKTGFFYEYYRLAEQGEHKYLKYDWSRYDTSEFLPNDELERYRRTMSEQIFRSDYLGEFLDFEGSVFGSFAHVMNAQPVDEFAGICTIGVDWGTGSGGDYTAISVMSEDKVQLKIDYFNNLDVNATIDRIIKLIYQYNPIKVVVELNSIGSVYFQLLKQRIRERNMPVQVIGFETTNESKQRLVNALQVNIQNGDVHLIYDMELMNEMSMYSMKLSKTNKPTYNATTGYHDDLVIATMLSMPVVNRGIYNIR